MCGIIGEYKINGFQSHEINIFKGVIHSLNHRGPDDSGAWISDDNRIALGHTRLSIQDLSKEGSQPMLSPSGRYMISFNGEIYNHLEIRKKKSFARHNWRGTSDTETLLASFDLYGILETIDLLEGMFAFALFDQKENLLFLCRDRFGEKPLYYGSLNDQSSDIIFSSEIQAISSHPNFQSSIDMESVSMLLKYNCIGKDKSIFKNILKLPPASLLKVNLNNNEREIHQYWCPISTAIKSKSLNLKFSWEEAINETQLLISKIVKRQMISDVPVGCFLSGGVDSSLIASMMQEHSMTPINTFTIGSHGSSIDEAKRAKQLASHIGSNHNEIYLTQDEIIGKVPKALKAYGEPFADSSQIPTLMVSELAKKHVSVALTGDAGDEIFGGYNRYLYTKKYWPYINRVPNFIRTNIFNSKEFLKPILLKGLNLFNADSRFDNLELKLQKALNSFSCQSKAELYDHFVTSYGYNECINYKHCYGNDYFLSNEEFSDFEEMMLQDTVTYLPDDILVKVDRASMHFSLETRAPYLDHNLFELLWKFPSEYRLNSNNTKLISRAINEKYFPKQLLNQPKTGFGIPIHDWIRGPLKDFSESMIFSKKVEELDLINPKNLANVWSEHLNRKKDFTSFLWSIISLGAWLEDN